MNTIQELIPLVDENDRVIGEANKLEVHQQGLLHRAFSVFLLRQQHKQWETLLQQRSSGKYHSGGLWTNSCCSHPYSIESITQAGERRLQEELGIQTPLYRVDHFIYKAHLDNGLIEHELDHVLIGFYENAPQHFNPQEVANLLWISIEDLAQDLSHSPEKFTPWLKPALHLLQNHWAKVEEIAKLTAHSQ